MPVPGSLIYRWGALIQIRDGPCTIGILHVSIFVSYRIYDILTLHLQRPGDALVVGQLQMDGGFKLLLQGLHPCGFICLLPCLDGNLCLHHMVDRHLGRGPLQSQGEYGADVS